MQFSDRDDVYKEKRRGQYRVSLKYDREPLNPREEGDCYFGTLVLPHRSYTIGETDDGSSLTSAVVRAIEEVRGPYTERIIARYLTCWWGVQNIIGVNFYEHSGYTVRTSGISSLEAAPDYRNGHPDGYIFDTPESRERCGMPDDPLAALKGEVEEFADYCEGNVYGVVVDRYLGGEDDEDEDEDDFEEVEAIWGHIGDTWAEQSAEEQLTYWCTHGDNDNSNDVNAVPVHAA